MIHNFRELAVWQKSMSLTRDIYRETKLFPQNEVYALCSQMQRAATSIPSNIAEGSGRATDKELVHFLNISLGSAYELETQLLIAFDAQYISQEIKDNLLQQVVEIEKMLYALIKKYNINI